MKNIIFDLYGTLMDIHTDEKKDEFWENVVHSFKKYREYSPFEFKEEYMRICNEKSKYKEEIELLDVFKELYPTADPLKIAIIFRKLSIEYLYPYKGVKRLLNQLKKNGYNLYLLSNAQSCFTMWELKKWDMVKYFKDIFISSDLGIKKPNKEFFLSLIHKHNLNINETIMIGNDYINDILPAKELGLKTIYIESNQSKKKEGVKKIKGFSYKDVLFEIKK